MKASINTYAQLLVQVCRDEAGSRLDSRIIEVLTLMKTRGDGHLIKRLEVAVADAYAYEVEGSNILVTTAGDPSTFKTKIASILKLHEEDIEVKQDKSLIGGAVVKVDNTIIDASIKGQLRQLASHLIK